MDFYSKFGEHQRAPSPLDKITLSNIYIDYYPPLDKKSENKQRYLLNFAIDPRGSVDKSSEELEKVRINGHVPWPWNSPFLQVIEMASNKGIADFSDIHTFFECGTAFAQTAVAMSNFFKVETVETLSEVYEANKDKKGLKYEINYHLGRGHEKLKEYLIENPDERLLILLDDHDPDLNAWIEEELIVIKRFSNRNDHIIIIDDLNHCGMGTYPYSQKLVHQLCWNINSSYQIFPLRAADILPLCRGILLVAPLIETPNMEPPRK